MYINGTVERPQDRLYKNMGRSCYLKKKKRIKEELLLDVRPLIGCWAIFFFFFLLLLQYALLP
jgi:hypothetical protein